MPSWTYFTHYGNASSPVGRYGEPRKSVADRSAQRSTPQSTNGNGVPHKKARPRHAQGIGVCLPALVRSGSGCRFHRISAVVAKCEGCYSKETQEVRYERLDPFRLAPRFRDVLGKLRHPRRRASGRVHPSVRRPMTVTELADRTGCVPQSLDRLLTALCAMGLLTVKAKPANCRPSRGITCAGAIPVISGI